ncbi:MAG: class I SAM-dependent methyltransferase [Gemmatimonadota bacterium]
MSHRYGFYGRLFAWLLAREGGKYGGFVEVRKRRLFAGLTGTLVEIGPGTGSNLRYLPGSLHIIGVEPNPFMHRYYLEEARTEARSVDLVQGVAESLPFPDGSIDAVLSTLVLCSVGRMDRVLEEVLRVLKPGGKFLFMEHVAAREGSWLRRVQRFIRPAWRRIGDGCEPDRTIEEDLLGAGFRQVNLDRFSVPLPIVSPHIAGTAEK